MAFPVHIYEPKLVVKVLCLGLNGQREMERSTSAVILAVPKFAVVGFDQGAADG
jgi:hypothetical protein